MILTLRGRGLVRKHLSKDKMPAFDQWWLEAFFLKRDRLHARDLNSLAMLILAPLCKMLAKSKVTGTFCEHFSNSVTQLEGEILVMRTTLP